MANTAYIASQCQSSGANIYRKWNLQTLRLEHFWSNTGNKIMKLLPRLEEYVKQKDKMSLVSVWHNDVSDVTTLEKKTLKIFHVLEDLNYGILRIQPTRDLEENPQKKVLVACQKNLMHKKMSYIIPKLAKSYRSCMSVLYELTPQHAQRRVGICRQLIDNPMDDRFIRRTVTCGEESVYYHNSDTSKQ